MLKSLLFPFILIASSSAALAQTTVDAPTISTQSTAIRSNGSFFGQGANPVFVGNANAGTGLLLNGIFVFNLSAIPSDSLFTATTLTIRHALSQGATPSPNPGYDLYFLGFTSASNIYPATAIYKADDIDQPSGDGIRVVDNMFDYTATNGQSVVASNQPLLDALNTRTNGGNDNFAFFRVNMDTVDTGTTSYIMLNNLPAAPGNTPTFSLTYVPVPEPSTLMLFASAGIGFLGMRRSRSSRS